MGNPIANYQASNENDEDTVKVGIEPEAEPGFGLENVTFDDPDNLDLYYEEPSHIKGPRLNDEDFVVQHS